ncbi:Selenide, water dikinase [bacterium HR23]|nr:Selenide, water dikinase [bacterium HR23]
MRHPNLLVGVETGDDAAVYRLGDGLALVLTTDFFPPIVDDPYWYGAIAVANSLSDVYAMGGKPLIALNILAWPMGQLEEELRLTLRGGYAKAQEADCLIVGGHTIDDKEPKYGLAVVGLIDPQQVVRNVGARPGDLLVLTKPLGTGVITTAAKQGLADPQVLERATQVMAHLNKSASEAMVEAGVHACTDITGYGLIGHLLGMVKGSEVGARLRLSQIPVLEGVWDLLEEGIAPGGTHRNLNSVGKLVRWGEGIPRTAQLLLCDAQTSGGLLMAVPPPHLPTLQEALQKRGEQGWVVGEITAEDRIMVER